MKHNIMYSYYQILRLQINNFIYVHVLYTISPVVLEIFYKICYKSVPLTMRLAMSLMSSGKRFKSFTQNSFD